MGSYPILHLKSALSIQQGMTLGTFEMENRIRYHETDQYGLIVYFDSKLYTKATKRIIVYIRECKAYLTFSNRIIHIGTCKLEFAGGNKKTFLDPEQVISLNLNLMLLNHEIVLLERHRNKNMLNIKFNIEFVFSEEPFESEKHGFTSIDCLQISKSDWENALINSDYKMSESLEVSPFISSEPSWHHATKTLEKARVYLNSGDGVAALNEVDRVLKQFVKHPYNGAYRKDNKQDSWKSYLFENFSQIEESKRDAISQLMQGFGGYLNKVSHHDEDIITPTSHYEHELMITTAQLLITYLYRLGIHERSNDLSVDNSSTSNC
ncbi:hypothetical protein [Desulfosporosinus sp. SB140]|uniref:hypothetical protein n=1 Tax=Desulfosporosinus paludis TaxID=3115649 RepID=UPI003890FD1D